MSISTVSVEKARAGMGSVPHESGVAFRVWSTYADAVYVVGSFDNRSSDAHPMTKEEDGYWYADVASPPSAPSIATASSMATRKCCAIDPYARQGTSSVGNAVVYDPEFDWGGDDFHIPPSTNW